MSASPTLRPTTDEASSVSFHTALGDQPPYNPLTDKTLGTCFEQLARYRYEESKMPPLTRERFASGAAPQPLIYWPVEPALDERVEQSQSSQDSAGEFFDEISLDVWLLTSQKSPLLVTDKFKSILKTLLTCPYTQDPRWMQQMDALMDWSGSDEVKDILAEAGELFIAPDQRLHFYQYLTSRFSRGCQSHYADTPRDLAYLLKSFVEDERCVREPSYTKTVMEMIRSYATQYANRLVPTTRRIFANSPRTYQDVDLDLKDWLPYQTSKPTSPFDKRATQVLKEVLFNRIVALKAQAPSALFQIVFHVPVGLGERLLKEVNECSARSTPYAVNAMIEIDKSMALVTDVRTDLMRLGCVTREWDSSRSFYSPETGVPDYTQQEFGLPLSTIEGAKVVLGIIKAIRAKAKSDSEVMSNS